MKLLYAPLSPFARKCRVVAMEKGLEKQLELVTIATADNPPELLAANPLGTVPALVLDDGSFLCESPVICEYLDSLAPTPILYPQGAQRFKILGLAALADGVMDASVACVVESRRAENSRSTAWIERKENAIRRTLPVLAAYKFGEEFDIGAINTAVALGYLSFRLPHIEWRTAHPELAAWYDAFVQRPSLAKTAPDA